MTPENLLSEWSRLLVESLADAGIRDVIVSPGSRSTPLVWAFLSSARMRCRSIVDERSAAFFAVGHAKATRVPAALVCTSGSAAANYFPAIVEASLSRTPLVVITADRPLELLDASAPQTIDQTKMYGAYVRRFADLGMPDMIESGLRGLRRRAAQAVHDSVDPDPGPVHLNFRARKPLEPVRASSSLGRGLADLVDHVLARPVTHASASPRKAGTDDLAALARDCAVAERGLVICGPSHFKTNEEVEIVHRFARRYGFPIYAEATSQLRFAKCEAAGSALHVDSLDVLLRSRLYFERFAPDLVIQLGEPPISSAWERFVASHPDLPRHVIANYGWPDPQGTARTLVIADVADALRTLLAAAAERLFDRPNWVASVCAANAAAWRGVDSVLTESPTLSEGAAVRAVVESMPDDSVLALGNSLPVRHVDAFVRRGCGRIRVVCQRGASGIDGVVSGAAGAASATGKPAVLVVGDLSALHDLGGFAAAASVPTPFVVVVLNNDGGRIFEQLPIANRDIDEEHGRFWTTPHGFGFRSAAELFRVRYEAPTSMAMVRATVGDALSRPGCTVVEIVVPPHGSREQYARLGVRVDEELGKLSPQ